MTATKIQPGDDLHLTLLMAPHSLNFVTGADRAALLAYGRDVFAAARDSKCLAQIEEPAKPVAEICSASHDDAEFGERAIKPLRDISGFEYGTQLYAGAVPDAVAPQGERQWICPTRTVADLVNNLLTMDQALPIYGAQYIEKDGRRCAIAVPPTVSRERVLDGRWIGQGEELNAAVVWTRAEQPAAEQPMLQDEYPHEQMDAMALDRYKVVPSNASMLWSHAVVAGDGTQQLYVGREVECQNMARKFAGAFLDGAFAFHSMAAAPTTQAAPALEAPAAPAVEALRALMSLVRREAPHLSGKVMGDADAILAGAALAAAPQAPAAPSPGMTPRDKATQDQIASVMLQHGTPEQQSQALAYASGAAPAAPAVDASDTALLDAMQRHRIALVPEHEGPWDAELYEEGEEPQHIGSGATPREALRAAIAAQAKEGGA